MIKKLIFIFWAMLIISPVSADIYNGIEYNPVYNKKGTKIKRYETPNGIKLGKKPIERIDKIYKQALKRVNKNKTLNAKQQYIYDNWNEVVEETTENNIPEYIKPKTTYNSLGDINRLLEKYGNIYIEIDISDYVKIQHKNERGIEYTGIKLTIPF